MKKYLWAGIALAAILVLFAFNPGGKKKLLPDNVEGISLLLDYETGYGGAIYPVYNPYVLFKNGTVVKEPYIPVEELETGALSKKEASNWGAYTKKGDEIIITWHNGKTATKKWPGNAVIAAGNGERLQGSFGSLSGSGNLAIGGAVGVFSYSNMSFTSSGKFTNKKVSGGSDARNTAYSARNTAGTYEIDGYMIKLTFNSGDVKRAFFCFYDQNKTTFRIGGRTFKEKK